MAQPVFYQTLNMVGVDPTLYYAVSASTTPEYPAPPYIVGTQAFGSDGSQFVFVQASTSISLTDFVVINAGTVSSAYMANSVTTTNVVSSLAVGLGATGLVIKGSVSFIPAAAYFWACTKGQYVPATTSGTVMATNTAGVILFTSSIAGTLQSITTSASLQYAFQGIICINSLTVSIPASIVPPAGGTTSNGYTVGPVVNLNNVRPVQSYTVSGTIITTGGIPLSLWSF
jgi:hypothetical protein